MSDITTTRGAGGDGTDGPNGPDDADAPEGFGSIEPIEIQEEMERSFLDYAMSVITDRALPDARDGLKPVHRRILYGMHDQGVRPDRSHVKCARVVGDVVGKYHPHSPEAVYDALARLAQDFSLRHPLIDGHGNFGSPHDPPGAMRYCVSAETLVATPDGEVAIADLVPDLTPDSEVDVELKVLDRRGEPVIASKVFHSGSHPTLRLRTEDGRELVGSYNHPVLCLVDVVGEPMLLWKLFEELKPGNLVATCDPPRTCDDLRAQGSITVAGSAELVFVTVASIEDAGVQPVYSLRVESEDHSFLTNGFVSHNTECRLAPIAMQMLAGIDEDTVDLRPNYDGKESEPVALPARFPNLLVNGGTGIGVAMASNIPPHNLGEVIDATIHLIDNPEATPDDLMQFVKGPDFPTGGLILGRAGILDALRTGRGSIRMRARAEIEEGKKGTMIVVTELPYQTSAENIAEKAAELVNSKVIEGIRDIRNERANRINRLVFELKRDANALVVLNNLYKYTPMQTNFGVNTVALVDGIPRTLNITQALTAYVEHQVDVITRRSQFRLKKATDRAHIVEGLLKALDMIDAIVALIRGAADRGAAREGLMAAPFEFTEIQANHILDLTLARLTRLGRTEYDAEMAELRETIRELTTILNDPVKLRQVIKDELNDIKKDFATPRLTEITYDPGELGAEDLIEDEPLVFTMTKAGYVKSTAAAAFRTQGRGGRGVQGAKLKEEDLVTHIVHTTAHAFLLFFSNRGRVFRLKAHEVPMRDRTARGTAIVNLLPLAPDEKVQAVIDTRDYEGERYLFFATKSGTVKKTLFSEYDKSRREGFIAINLREGDELVRVIQTSGHDDIFMVSRMGQTIRFNEEDVRPTGRAAAGVRGMRLKSNSGDEVVSCDVARDDVAILLVTDAGYGKRTQLDKFNRQARGGQGVRGIKLTARKGYVVSAFMVGLDDEVFLISSGGVTMRIPVRDVSSQGRDATGVRVMNLDPGQTVASVAPILSSSEEDEQ